MATSDYEMCNPPKGDRQLELFVQHAYGFSVMEDVYKYAVEHLDDGLSQREREVAVSAIRKAIYGLMMMHDGVPTGLRNKKYELVIKTVVGIQERGKENGLIGEVDLFNGDGMCMGVHGWFEGNFGKEPVAISKGNSQD